MLKNMRQVLNEMSSMGDYLDDGEYPHRVVNKKPKEDYKRSKRNQSTIHLTKHGKNRYKKMELYELKSEWSRLFKTNMSFNEFIRRIKQ